MAKDRNAVTCNGRTAFYACMYEDIRHCAMDCGWAVSLHGSLSSDMDIMALPWVENAVSFKEMIDRVSKLFKDNDMSSQYVITYNEKPHNRVVATIPIWSDFYLDISTVNTADVVPKSEVAELETKLRQYEQVCGKLIVKDGVGIGLLPDGKETVYILKSIAGVTKELAIRRTKQEVAREIFEEIEDILKIVKIPSVNADGCITPLRVGYWAIDPNDYATLKKKYTEGAE